MFIFNYICFCSVIYIKNTIPSSNFLVTFYFLNYCYFHYSTTKKELAHINKVLAEFEVPGTCLGEAKRKCDAVWRSKHNKVTTC